MAAENETTMGIIYSPHPDIRVRGITVENMVMTVVLEGQIRYQSVAGLQEFLFEQICKHMPQMLILDFQQVGFLDSQGLAFLISLYKFCFPQGCTLAVRGANPHVNSLMTLTRLNAFIKSI